MKNLHQNSFDRFLTEDKEKAKAALLKVLKKYKNAKTIDDKASDEIFKAEKALLQAGGTFPELTRLRVQVWGKLK